MTAPQEPATPADGPPGAATPRSGLRNPEAAVRGLGAGTLVLEAIVLLLAIQPIRILGGHLSGWGDRGGRRPGGRWRARSPA